MKLYFHFGFPRTGTTTLQVHLFPNHPQINYLGRHPRVKTRFAQSVYQSSKKLELVDLAIILNDDDFDNQYNELLKKAEEFYLDPNKINVISEEHIVWNAIHYNPSFPFDNDNFRTVSRTVSRINSLFSKINVDTYFFCSIRSQNDMIRSVYSITPPELNLSLTFTGEEIIQYLKTKNINKPSIIRFLNGFNYWELYKNISKAVGENKIKFFLYEEFMNNHDNFVSDLSNYLKIDPAISIKLLKYSRENTSIDQIKESPLINGPLSIIFSKIAKNFKNPRILFQNFDKKILNMIKLLNKQIRGFDKKDKEILKIKKKNLIKQLNMIKNNSPWIKKYYQQDCLALKEKLGLDIDKHNYF